MGDLVDMVAYVFRHLGPVYLFMILMFAAIVGGR